MVWLAPPAAAQRPRDKVRHVVQQDVLRGIVSESCGSCHGETFLLPTASTAPHYQQTVRCLCATVCENKEAYRSEAD